MAFNIDVVDDAPPITVSVEEGEAFAITVDGEIYFGGDKSTSMPAEMFARSLRGFADVVEQFAGMHRNKVSE